MKGHAREVTHTLADELRRAARDSADRPFLRMMQGEWTFAEIDRQSDLAASALARQGVGKGDVVSLMLPNCLEFVVLWFALAKLGAVMAPINTAFRGQILLDAANLVESRLLVAHAGLREQWHPQRSGFATIETVIVVGGGATSAGELAYAELLEGAREAAPLPPPPVTWSDPCVLLYTSGTTGRSKAAIISHRFALAHGSAVIDGLGLRADDVLYCPYPLFHLDASVMTIVPALLLRATAAIGERFSLSRYWDEVRALKATVFDFMGATLTMLWKQPRSPADRDHRARLGWGVPLPEWAQEFEARFGCRLVELYGATEIGAMIYTPQDEPRRRGTCGKVIEGWEAKILAADGSEAPPNEPGELVVRGTAPGLIMDGYFGMPDATREALREGWFHTGDILRRDADGYFYFVGRRKDMVRRRGDNISAAEVELVIETHPDVLECAVYGVPSELTEEEVMAAVVRRPGAALSATAFWQYCKEKLPRFMIPRYVRFVSALPKTPTDKVEKFRLAKEGPTPDTIDREREAINEGRGA